MSLRRRSVLTLSTLLLAAGVSPAVVPSASAEEGQVIATAVGDGQRGDTGDGSSAVEARLNEPRMIALDGQGGYYVTDTYNHRIRHVDSAGVITNIAGTGEPGFRDGPGSQAMFSAPHSVDVDAAGNIIVGDPVNNRVRMIEPYPPYNVTTIAGHTDRRTYTGDGGPAAQAGLNDSKIALVGPDGNIYVADYGNSVIRRIRMDHQPPTMETFAGTDVDSGPFCEVCRATEAFFKPRNITFDIDGDLLVADRESNTVRSIAFNPDGTAGDISWIAGVPGPTGFSGDGGPATEAQLSEPRGLGVDWMGNVYIADSTNNRVRRVDTDGIITTVAGNGDSGKGGLGGPPTEADLNNPRHVIFDRAGTMYITDTGGHRVLKVENFIPAEPAGSTSTTTTSTTAPGTTPTTAPGSPNPSASTRSGYWMLGSDGALYPFGEAGNHGDAIAALPAGATAADVEGTPTGNGYWVLDTTGTVYSFGDAAALGSMSRNLLLPGESATSLSATPTGQGYWIFTTRGQAVAFGDADHHGDMLGTRLNAPVLDSVATPTGKGYYMVAGDGGIFSFGDAEFWGSMGDMKLNAPVQSLVPDADGVGYWLVASDGGVFAFEAPFRGSMGAIRLNQPITGMVRQGDGYLMVAADGGIFNFSDQPFSGSLGDNPPARPIVAVAVLPR